MITFSIQTDLDYIHKLVRDGGPEAADYPEFNRWLADTYQRWERGVLSPEQLQKIREAFGQVMCLDTMFGHTYLKPHGYAGDFEIIDRIYQEWVVSTPELAKWDRLYHHQSATIAVRNRKRYFHQLLDRHYARTRPLRMLEIGSGPGRSLAEWLNSNLDADVWFDCVELDSNAIHYAENINSPYLDRIRFIHQNALRFRPEQQYDLIWAAGIFDYFSDRLFTKLLVRLFPAVAPGGELVIGNFSDQNPTRCYMEIITNWVLNHRSPEQLSRLAREGGIPISQIRIDSEPEGVNLFLHCKAGSESRHRSQKMTQIM